MCLPDGKGPCFLGCEREEMVTERKEPKQVGLQARAVLMGQWGFGKNGDLAGTVCLFTGEPGTGKTLAAEAVGFETGKPLKVTSSLVRAL